MKGFSNLGNERIERDISGGTGGTVGDKGGLRGTAQAYEIAAGCRESKASSHQSPAPTGKAMHDENVT